MPALRASPRRPAAVVLVLTLLLGIQPVTTDLYLPALPTLQQALGAPIGAAQLTLSALMVAFGLGQLVFGPLSDRFGRRPVLLAGVATYVVASVGAALAPEIASLVAWRALQGAAMAAAVTCGRAIVRDLYEPAEGARVMARAMTGLGVIAVASPIAGGLLVEAWDWRSPLLALALFGAVALAVVAWRFDESATALDPRATDPRRIVDNWRAIAGHPTFRAWALLAAATYGGIFTMLAASSFVLIGVLGVPRAAYGAILATMSASYIVGTLVCRRLVARHGLAGTAARGAGWSLAGGGTMALLSLAGVQSVWAIMVPLWVYAIGHGILQPCGMVGAVAPFPEKAGVAASLSGFAMMAVAFAIGLALGASLDRPGVYPLTLGIGLASLAAAVVAWTLVQRHAEAPRGGAIVAETPVA